MDHEQLEKRVEWLDKERRENKAIIDKLMNRIAVLEGKEKKNDSFVKGMSSDLTHLSVQITKMDDFDESLVKHRTDVKTQIDKQNKLAKNREREAKKNFSLDNKNMQKNIAEITKKTLQIKILEDAVIDTQSQFEKVTTALKTNDEKIIKSDDLVATQVLKTTSLEDEIRISSNQINEFSGEIAALRKKIDEHSSQIELSQLSDKRMDDKWGKFLIDQGEKLEFQSNSFEAIISGYEEQKIQWKVWNKKIDELEEQSKSISSNLLNLDEAEGSLKIAREGFQGITEQIDRRINEITEIQRLGDERYRQEWVTFKSDQQKRWTNQSLTQEEQHKNIERQNERMDSDLNSLTSDIELLQEVVNMMNENSDKRLSILMTHFRDWLNESEKQTKRYSS